MYLLNNSQSRAVLERFAVYLSGYWLVLTRIVLCLVLDYPVIVWIVISAIVLQNSRDRAVLDSFSFYFTVYRIVVAGIVLGLALYCSGRVLIDI